MTNKLTDVEKIALIDELLTKVRDTTETFRDGSQTLLYLIGAIIHDEIIEIDIENDDDIWLYDCIFNIYPKDHIIWKYIGFIKIDDFKKDIEGKVFTYDIFSGGIITIGAKTKKYVLGTIGFDIDCDGYIINKETGLWKLSNYREPIKLDEFGGAIFDKKTKEYVFYKNDLGSLIELSDELKKRKIN